MIARRWSITRKMQWIRTAVTSEVQILKVGATLDV